MRDEQIQSDNVDSTKTDALCDKAANNPVLNNCPFNLEWIFGFNSSVPLINLTVDPSEKIFATASAHVFQIFRCDGNEMQSFVGHERSIVVLETNSTGRFILSADESGVINIWDASIASEFPHPIRTIYEPYRHQLQRKLSKVAFSADGKNIVTASDGRGSVIKLWQWSMGATNDVDNPSDSFELPEKYEQVESVRFDGNENESTVFIVTAKNGIVLCQWDRKNQKLQRHFPARAISISFRFVDSVLIENSPKAMSITRCGSAVIWSNILFAEDESSASVPLFKKEFIKVVKLSERELRVIKSVDGYVMISDALGHIRFYDEELKILFWCPSNDSIDSIVTISFDLKRKLEDDAVELTKCFSIRDFFVQTRSDIFSVDVAQMKFNRIFFKSDDAVTAIDVFPSHRSLICCANHSGRIFIYDYEKKILVVESRLKLQRRKSLTSDTDIIETPHITALTFSPDGHHLLCGLANGTLITLDPNVLHELKSFKLNHQSIRDIKFSPDSSFIAVYDEASTVSLLHHDKALLGDEWKVLGRQRYHTKPICDILYITPLHATPHHKVCPRLISLAQDRQIVEYDLSESLKESRGLVITFVKRIFQTSLPMSMTLVFNSTKGEEQLLIADTKMKFKLFDKNTFEILATFMGPIYDSYVERFVSIYGSAIQMAAKEFRLGTGLTLLHSKMLVFTTNKHICLYALPVDGNPFRSLGVVGHCSGIKNIKVDSTRQVLFAIGHSCQSLFMWNINSRPVLEHFEEGGGGLKPYCELLPGGKFGLFLQQMQNLYYYMLMLSNNNCIDDRTVNEGLGLNEVADFMRGMGFFPTDYEIECLHHELEIRGKKKISFEDLVKLHVNHSHLSPNGSEILSLEVSIKSLLDLPQAEPPERINIKKSQIVSMLTSDAEKVDEKDAEYYLKDLFRHDEASLQNFIQMIAGSSQHCLSVQYKS